MTLKSRLLIALGFILLAVGAVGIFVPVLPTTPFVLAAAGCFSGSAKLTGWLNKSKLFSDYIKNYREHNGLKKRTVITSLTFLWTMLGISAVCVRILWVGILLFCIGVAVTTHILYVARPRPMARGDKKTDGLEDR